MSEEILGWRLGHTYRTHFGYDEVRGFVTRYDPARPGGGVEMVIVVGADGRHRTHATPRERRYEPVVGSTAEVGGAKGAAGDAEVAAGAPGAGPAASRAIDRAWPLLTAPLYDDEAADNGAAER